MGDQRDRASWLGPGRRRLLQGVSFSLLAAGMIPPARAADTALTPDQAYQALVEGHARYHAGMADFGDYTAGRAERSRGQSPIAAVLSCADSRVPPELLFGQGPGGLFVVRVAGNVENAEAMASLEYGTHFLRIPLIVVLGHSGCGAVDAAIKVYRDKVELPGHLPGLVNLITPSVAAAAATNPADLLAAATLENVRTTMQAIATTEPLLAAKVRAGTVRVVGGVYDLATGKITLV